MKTQKKRQNALILSHFLINPISNAASSTGMAKFLNENRKFNNIVQIEQPFPGSKDDFSYVLEYSKDKIKKTKYKAVKKPDWFAYLLHPLINLLYLVRIGYRYNIAIACENLSFLSVYPLKKIGLINYAVYYSVDYTEKRFGNKLTNFVYHAIDRFALKNSDENWVVAKEQIKARRRSGVNINKYSPFRIVPIGFRGSEIKIKTVDAIDYYQLAFCGTLRETAGPQIVLAALPKILRKFPKVKIIFIGGGDTQYLRTFAKKLGVSEKVEFRQNVVKHNELVNILTNSSIGLAPYVSKAGSISLTSDPGKIKLYLLCGLPVITTKVATSHKILLKNRAGVVAEENSDSLANAVIKILENKKRYRNYKNSAIKLGKEFDSDKIFSFALADILK